MRTPSWLLVAVGLTVGAVEASAQEACEDEAARPLSGQRLLRRWALDLADRTPTREEIAAQTARGAPPGEAEVDAFLDSEAFIQVMRRHHEELLWPNIDQVEIIPQTSRLTPIPLGGDEPVYLSIVRSVFTRTTGSGNLYTPCLDEPARYDERGRLVFEPMLVGTTTVAWQEGWVEVEPYWAPGTTIRVCALDALENQAGTVCPGPSERYPFAENTCNNFDGYSGLVQEEFRGSLVACNTEWSFLSPECGCGPGLRWCSTVETEAEIRRSLLDQMMRIVEGTLREGRPYHEVLTQPQVEFNGPVAHYMQHMSQLSFDTRGGLDATAPPPGLAYTDRETWVAVTRTGRHAGVLTTPGYLLKHQSDRQRAHRFYNAFECSSFIPNGPLPSPFEPCSQREDLTERCGCDACHITLEPMAAHWGRFSEYGFRHLDEQRYPEQGLDMCRPPIADYDTLIRCLRYYELAPVGQEVPYRGYLMSYVFREGDERLNIDIGPRRLAESSIESGRFSSCAVRRMWSYFMRREPTATEAGDTLPALEADFVAASYNLETLVKAIVTHPAYRRAP